VEILDLGVEQVDLESYLLEFKPDVLGITATTPTLKQSLHISELAKRILPEVKVILGGPHPTVDPEGVLRSGSVDIVVIGEGEETVRELINALSSGSSLVNVAGICYNEDGRPIKNPPRPLIADLDSIAPPARELLKLDRYPNHALALSDPGASVITSRGCPGQCIYCSKHTFGSRFRARSPDNILDEIELLVNEYGVKEIQFVDDTLTLDKRRIVELCQGIVKRKLDITWMAPNGIRVGTVDRDTLAWMRKSGCHFLFLGVESGNQNTIEKIKKGTTLKQVRQTVKLVKEAGIGVGGFFMIGLPGETKEDVEESILFARTLKLDAVKFGLVVPLPGTPLFEQWDKLGYIKNYNFEEYFWHKEPVFETDKLSKEEMFELYKKAYRNFYLTPSYMLHKITSTRSIKDLENNFWGLISIIRNQLS